MRIFKYLKFAPQRGIMFKKNASVDDIAVHINVDWAGALVDRRSTLVTLHL